MSTRFQKTISTLPKKQQGVALMIVIFVFALVSILSVGMYNRQSIFVQQAGNLLAQTQAYQYAIASEIYARRLLKEDWDNDKKDGFVDDLEFVKSSLTRPFEQAIVSSQFNDVQGKLNINDLVGLKGQVNAVTKERFMQLFSRLSIETLKVEQVIDWLDENQDPEGFEGAEDGDYLSLDPSYRTAGQMMQDISELRLLPNISNEDYQKLLPHVTVLPQGWAPLNVNTASEEVLQSLSSKLSDAQAKSLAESTERPWKDLDAFKADPLLSGLNIDFNYLGVRSDHFQVATKITLADRTVRLVSLIYRDNKDGAMKVLRRDQGQKYLITKDQVAL